MEGRTQPRADVPATFPASSEYADYVLRIERPRDADGRELLNQGWDLLYEKKDGTAAFNHWADDWNEVLLYFAEEDVSDAPPWIAVGLFKGAIFPA